jgi:hypothetical protein
MAGGALFFEIIEDAKPIAEDQWKGVSGMPVFVGSQILGIVKHIPPHYDHKKLQAVPTWRLLDCKSFKQALGVLHDELERLERARQLLIDLLEGSEDVTRALVYDLDSQSLYARLVRSAYRYQRFPDVRDDRLGFRCARIRA